MTIESKNHREPTASVRVSQGSRRMAQPAAYVGQYETYSEERVALVKELQGIEEQLAGYTDAHFSREQARIRQQNLGLQAWLTRRGELQTAKERLLQRKHQIQSRLAEIKPLVAKENVARSKEEDETGGRLREIRDILQDVLYVLREIRDRDRDIVILPASPENPPA